MVVFFSQVLRPSCHLRNLSFWSSVYLSEVTSSVDSQLDDTLESTPSEGSQDTEAGVETTVLTKTRSCDDIVAALADASSAPAPLIRRLSDPNIASDPNCLLGAEMARSVEGSTFIDSIESDPCKGKAKEAVPNGVACETAEDVALNGDVNCEDCEEKCKRGKMCLLKKCEAVIESSTDTLTGNLESEAQMLSRNGSNQTLHTEGKAEGDNNEDGEEVEVAVAAEPALEHCISISTSTTELSDSHIRGQKIKCHSKATGTALSLYIPETVGHVAQVNGVTNGGCSSQRVAEPPSMVPSSRASNSSMESESCSPALQQSRTPGTISPPTPGMEKVRMQLT